jgi:ParB family chromosome partitioning protein
MSKPALGRGLGALLGGAAPAETAAPTAAPATPPGGPAPADLRERVLQVAVDRIVPNPFQPRKDFTDEALEELTESIKAQGVLQPLVVRRRGEHWELIAGERRWRAARRAGLATVPVIEREVSDTEALELALIENLQRENLNPIEEALGFRQLIEQFNLRQEDAAQKVGKSRVAVANALRLLKLPEDVQALVRKGQLSAGHAKAILGLPTPEQQKLAANLILRDGLNVRQAEELVTRLLAGPTVAGPARKAGRGKAERDVHVADLEARLQARLGAKVSLRYREGRGAVEIRFFSDEELERLLELLGARSD